MGKLLRCASVKTRVPVPTPTKLLGGCVVGFNLRGREWDSLEQDR